MAAALWAKRWNDLLGPSHHWPRAIQKLIYTWGGRHLRNAEWFTVVVFLLTNGISPELIVQWFKENPCKLYKKGMLHVAFIIREFPRKKWRAWNVMLKRSE